MSFYFLVNFPWYFEIRPCQRCKGHPPCSVPPRAWWWLTSHNLSSSWPWRCETNTQSEGQRKKNRTCNTLMICRGLLSQKSPHLSKVNWTDFSQHVKSVYIHDDFLPDGVVGNKSRGLFFVCHWLRGIHDVLEHGSLSVWRETGHVNWAAFLQLSRSRLWLAVLLHLALTVAAKWPICSKPTWSKVPDLWRWCRRRTSAAHSQTDASGGCRRCSSSAGDHE